MCVRVCTYVEMAWPKSAGSGNCAQHVYMYTDEQDGILCAWIRHCDGELKHGPNPPAPKACGKGLGENAFRAGAAVMVRSMRPKRALLSFPRGE